MKYNHIIAILLPQLTPWLPDMPPSALISFAVVFVTLWVQLVLPRCVWMWDHRLEPRKPISDHILKKQWFSFPSSSIVGTPASVVAGREMISVRWRMKSDWLHFCRGWVKSLQILSLWASVFTYLSTVKFWGKSPGDNYHNKLRRGLHWNSFAKPQSTCGLYTKSELLSDKQNSG